MSTRARAWAVAVCALCLLAGVLAEIALGAPSPARRGCRPAHSARCAARACRAARVRRSAHDRCAGVHRAGRNGDRSGRHALRSRPRIGQRRRRVSPGFGRQPRGRGAAPGTPAPPAGSAEPASPNPSVPAATATQPSLAQGPGGASEATRPAGEAPTGAPASGPARVQVIAKEYSFTLSRPEVPAGEVVLELVNRGEDAHNLHVAEGTAGAEQGATPNTEPGAVRDLHVTLRPGSYTLFCSLPGHEAKGMHATLVVH
jgi:plastocyanin